MNSSSNITALLGRLLISPIFLFSGFSKLAMYSQVVGFAAAKGMPMPEIAIALAAATEIICGLAVLIGLKTRAAAWLLFLYLIPTTLIFHNFWASSGAEHQEQMLNFVKNVTIMGGLLILAANGAGGYSLDRTRAAKA
jgi:putative oxidoreductase